MKAYGALAGAYDGLTYDIPYEAILQFWEAVLEQEGKHPQRVLDLACGTGSLSVLMAGKGYTVLGCDISEEMLTQAADKAADMEENAPFFICQPMQKLRLPMKMDWIVCCLDGINYLTDPSDCQKTFRRCYDSLEQGGIFTFDINSAYKLKNLNGQVWLDENEESYCVWRTEFEEETNLCHYGIDLFAKEGKLWRRSAEEHWQYAYSVEELTAYLQGAGFAAVRVYGDLSVEAPGEAAQRIFIAAIKE